MHGKDNLLFRTIILLANGSEKRDSCQEYVKSHNAELLGIYGTFINYSLRFLLSYFEGKVPKGKLSEDVRGKAILLYITAEEGLERGGFKEFLNEILKRYVFQSVSLTSGSLGIPEKAGRNNANAHYFSALR